MANYKNKKKLQENTFKVTVLAVNIHIHPIKNMDILQDNVILDINVPNKYKNSDQEIIDFVECSTYNILSHKFKTEVTYCQMYIQDDDPAYTVNAQQTSYDDEWADYDIDSEDELDY